MIAAKKIKILALLVTKIRKLIMVSIALLSDLAVLT